MRPWPNDRVLRTLLLTTVACSLMISTAAAAGPEMIPLWPDGAPGAVGTESEDIPGIRLYPADPEKATGAFVVVLPGGGYHVLAMDHEGHQVAKWLNSIGVSAGVVNYRLGPRYKHPAMMQDAQRGIRYVRANAEELGIDPNRVGIMGFSAGGHLASTVSTHYDKGDADSDDPVAKQSSRPDFSILCYPVISLEAEYTHRGSGRNLLGENPDPELLHSLSNETQVTEDTPPTFIFQTAADTVVPAFNALDYFQALLKHKVPAELHVYQNGPHGVGLAPGDPVIGTWPARLKDWLQVNGFLDPAERVKVSGEVKLNGEPLAWGMIRFTPANRPNAPIAYGMISRGKYNLEKPDGPITGKNEITIFNLGAVEPTPTIEDAEVAGTEEVEVTDEESTLSVDLK